MYITDSVPRLAFKNEPEEGGLFDGIVLPSTASPVARGAQERLMREVDPLDLVETIREGLLVIDPDLTVRFANRSFCVRSHPRGYAGPQA